jgi:hypothetical protein
MATLLKDRRGELFFLTRSLPFDMLEAVSIPGKFYTL